MTAPVDGSAPLTTVLEQWADGIRLHDPDRVASFFTEDAVFQGFDPAHTVGRAGVRAYYDKQPVGLTPTFTVRETRSLAADALLAFVDVDFAPPGRDVIPTHLTIVLTRVGDAWLIAHYHVSKIGG